ncbi:hypothetical protein [Niameybacter massiliensis]|uniref:hypothetical protein n=1 Tax=Niameybacter massiliensis TaxID=1658108 RepID=UPI0006B573FD|nr:hypothetical protein [Niameybacter massiliensis]
MKKVIFLNGSPKQERSVTHYYIEELKKLLGEQVECEEIYVAKVIKQKDLDSTYKKLTQVDQLVIGCSLYVDTLYAGLLSFLEGFETYLEVYPNLREPKTRVYALCNNGFLQGEQNKYALRNLRFFTEKIGYSWQFGLGLGAGEMMYATRDQMPMEFVVKRQIGNALRVLSRAILNEEETKQQDLLVSPKIPIWMFNQMGNQFWKDRAKKGKVSVKMIRQRIY